MGPNDVELTRVYTRQAAGKIADATLSSGDNFEVVTEVEAGAAVFNQGAQYKTDIVIRDLSANTNIPYQPTSPGATGIAGALGSAPWTAQAQQLVYTVLATDLTGREGHLCEVYAYLLEGNKDPDASFLVSQPFLIQQP